MMSAPATPRTPLACLPVRSRLLHLLSVLLLGFSVSGHAGERGRLLYETHCIGCHTEQAHWRDRRLVTDWRGLREEVRRWQAIQSLGWTEADITLVARHLNQRHYRLPERAQPPGQPAGVPAEGKLAGRPIPPDIVRP